jgi:hypothetical protein
MFKKFLAFIGIGKLSKETAKYTDNAESVNDCHLCLSYFPDALRCDMVAGRISPNGWCKHFSAKVIRRDKASL